MGNWTATPVCHSSFLSIQGQLKKEASCNLTQEKKRAFCPFKLYSLISANVCLMVALEERLGGLTKLTDDLSKKYISPPVCARMSMRQLLLQALKYQI